tara:strand:+ start:276 stop:866 length:591 start_codon:yes stop_codon:yes gene_type:complete
MSIFTPSNATNNSKKEINEVIYELYSRINNYWKTDARLNNNNPPQLIITDKKSIVMGGCLYENETSKILHSHFCGKTNTIFLTNEDINYFYERHNRIGVLFLAAHEVAHSIQYGVSSGMKKPLRELQADCIASRLVKMFEPNMSNDEKAEFSEMFIFSDSDTHGTGIQRMNAIKMGLGLSKGDCVAEEIMDIISKK